MDLWLLFGGYGCFPLISCVFLFFFGFRFNRKKKKINWLIVCRLFVWVYFRSRYDSLVAFCRL